MPLKRMLEEARSFDPKATAPLMEAFDTLVAELDLRADDDREKAARIVIRLAHGQATLEAAKLRDEGVRLMRKGGARAAGGPSDTKAGGHRSCGSKIARVEHLEPAVRARDYDGPGPCLGLLVRLRIAVSLNSNGGALD
jgi:hypothetical protein